MVVPTYNRAALLQHALASVADQDYRPLEVMVVDDASRDDTGSVLERARGDLGQAGIPLVSHVLGGHSGTAAARNAGLRLASGAFVAFLDSDDLWRPSFVSTLVRLLQPRPACGLAFSGILGITEHDAPIRVRESGLPAEPTEGCLPTPFEHIVRHMPLQTSGVVVRRTVFDTVGMFDETLESGQDWDLWYRIAKQFDFAYTVSPLACNRIHQGNVPKYGPAGLACRVRIGLRYLGDVRDLPTRKVLVERIQEAQTLLQEQLMREGLAAREYESLLANELTPDSVRYRLGRRVLKGPAWLGRWYARAIGTAGRVRRWLRSPSPHRNVPAETEDVSYPHEG